VDADSLFASGMNCHRGGPRWPGSVSKLITTVVNSLNSQLDLTRPINSNGIGIPCVTRCEPASIGNRLQDVNFVNGSIPSGYALFHGDTVAGTLRAIVRSMNRDTANI